MYGDSMTKTKMDKEKVDVLTDQFKKVFTEEPDGDINNYPVMLNIVIKKK